MKALVVIGACLLANAAWAQQKVQSVVVTNPSLTVQAADAGRYTHVGQKPSQVVNLEIIHGGSASRIDPATGLADGTPFIVPDGYVFILTQIHGGTGCAVGSSGVYQVRQLSSFNTIRDFIPWGCPSNQFFVGFNRHYVTGLLFGAGSQVLGEGANEVVKIEGYLVPAD